MEANFILAYSVAGLAVGTFALAIAIMLYLQYKYPGPPGKSSKRN